MAALSRTRTVGEVISAMQNEVGASAVTAAPASPVRETTSVPVVPTTHMGGDATKVVMEVLASKTGYDVDMIEDDMELETELGIDSIKRVEILSEVQSRLGVEAKDVAALSRTRTVGEVISAMANEMGGAAPAPAAYAAPASAAAPAAAAAPLGGDATKVVMEVLASKTGYDVDMIEDLSLIHI